MGGKPIKYDLQTFIDSVNKKDKNHNGKRVRFGWLKKKRRY